jgi:hypothetical protein
MADDIFGAGLDRQVDAMPEGVEEQRRRPGVVEQHRGAMPMGNAGDQRHVLHLEALRPRSLQVDGLGIGADQRLDTGADQRVVIGYLDAEAAQHPVAELAGRLVGRVNHQKMVARRKAGEQGG